MKKIKFLPLLLIVFLCGCSVVRPTVEINNTNTNEPILADIYFVDVGQADATLVISDNQTLLIDTGDIDTKENLFDFLEKLNITKIDYLILTHPHADHIGGASHIVNNYQVGEILMPNKITTSNVFETLIDDIGKKGYEITIPEQDATYTLGNGKFTILTDQNLDWGDDLNAWSIGVKITFGDNDLIVTGDLEESGEKTILDKNLNAEILKLGHHGSSTSTSDKFLKKVNPQIAIISCGAGNSYGHPHKEILTKMEKNKITYYRTDLCGTIKIEVRETSLNILDKDILPNNENVIEAYVLNTNSKKIHLENCSSVEQISPKNKKVYEGKLDDIIKEGYETCKSCLE